MDKRYEHTMQRIIDMLLHYVDLRDVYYSHSNWLTPMPEWGGQGCPWEDLVTRKIDIDRAIARLTTRQREVVVRYFLLDQNEFHIADIMGTSQQAVSKTLYSGLRAMARFLGPRW